jgi:hypothetical protein
LETLREQVPSLSSISPGSSVGSSACLFAERAEGIAQEVRRYLLWRRFANDPDLGGWSLPHSSMAEQAAVKREVVGSSPTEAANLFIAG